MAGLTIFEKNKEQSAESCLVVKALAISLLGRNARAGEETIEKLTLYSSKAIVFVVSQNICYYKLGPVEARKQRYTHCANERYVED